MLPWNAEDLTFDESTFSGVGRLFPLPNLVMFPHVMQPLHIFEPRYREMLNEALDGDGLLAMSVLQGDEDAHRPELCSHVCLGRIVTHHRLDDGHYNILLLGMRRARIVRELETGQSFRSAEVELIDDLYPGAGHDGRAELQRVLTERFGESLDGGPAVDDAMRSFLSDEAPLGVLTDLVSFAAPLDVAAKCRLLGENNVDHRAEWLIRWLEQAHSAHAGKPKPATHPAHDMMAPKGKFPPKFSIN
ncbi:MAG: LON peptidase substrate-binding domain-containing protein [Planctomycetales bacterium]|nr:LON peptidase substrate-binding domain-containing protein [Planctomycetales bacterium]